MVCSQRRRMLRGMAEAVSENGYASTPVAEVLRRAGVSRETFYEQFANKEECFMAAYDASVALLLGAIGDARHAPNGDGGQRSPDEGLDALLERALERYLAVLAQEPAAARTFLVEVYAAGEAALARRVEVHARFVDAVIGWVGARGAEQRFACEAIVAAITGLVTQWVCAGRSDELGELSEPVMQHVRSVLPAYGLLRSREQAHVR